MMHSEACPLCAATEGATHQVHICGNCHTGLHVTGALPVSVTGEFSAVSDALLEAHLDAEKAPRTDSTCCWCNKEAAQVRKVLSQGSYHICNECVALCADILRMELGDDYGNS
jgi:hypothetical protein